MLVTRRPLNINDLPACLQLTVDRGWEPDTAKWKLLLKVGEGWGIDHPDGGLAASVILTRHGTNVAVIGMLMVRRDLAGQGLGRSLLRYILRRARTATVYVYADQITHPFYAKLGFVTVDRLITHRGKLTANFGTSATSRVFEKDDLPEILAVDQAAFGAERTRLIDELVPIAKQIRVTEQKGKITGYGMVWKSLDVVQIGPVVAADNETALRLIVDLARDQHVAVRMDLARQHDALSAWAKEVGLTASSETSMMVFNNQEIPGNRSCLYTVAMQATG